METSCKGSQKRLGRKYDSGEGRELGDHITNGEKASKLVNFTDSISQQQGGEKEGGHKAVGGGTGRDG